MSDYKKLVEKLRYCGNNPCSHECEWWNPERKMEVWSCVGANLTDAAAAIEAMEAKVPHWVSVEDELPKNVANRVLAFCENGVMYAAHYEGGETDKWYMNMGTWWEEGTGKLTVTHWMPIPEPPQEDKSDDS